MSAVGGNLGTYTPDVIQYVLDHQLVKNWVLVECDYRNQFEYGIIERVWVDRRYEDAEQSSLVVANKEASITSSLADMADRQRIEQTMVSRALAAILPNSSGRKP